MSNVKVNSNALNVGICELSKSGSQPAKPNKHVKYVIGIGKHSTTDLTLELVTDYLTGF